MKNGLYTGAPNVDTVTAEEPMQTTALTAEQRWTEGMRMAKCNTCVHFDVCEKHIPDWINEEINEEVIYWMPLPKQPKGE